MDRDDGDEVDLTGLMESIVDSDEEEDLAESIDVSPFYYGLHLHAQLFVGGFFSLLIPVVIMSLFE